MTPITLGPVTIAITADSVTTTLPTGRVVHGVPHDTDAYRATAQAQGYGDDTDRMNRTHEVAHSLLAHWVGTPWSPVLHRVACGRTDATETTRLKEEAVMATERYANHLGVELVDVARRTAARSRAWAGLGVWAVVLAVSVVQPAHSLALTVLA